LIENFALLEERGFFEIIQCTRDRHMPQDATPVDSAGFGRLLNLHGICNHALKANPGVWIKIAKKTT
jgi:hypothetical protein